MESLIKSKQIRRSTGTSDLALAKQKQHSLTNAIHEMMDREWQKAFRQWRAELKEEWSEDATEFASSLGVVRENFSPDRYRRFLDEAVQAILNDALMDGKVKWSGEFGQRAKMYLTRLNGYKNDKATEFFRQV